MHEHVDHTAAALNPGNALPPEGGRLAGIDDFAARLEERVGQVVFGQSHVVRHLLVALLVQGHVLLEGNPGTAKTLLVRTLARSCELRFRRVQFTPDLMPSDITGTSIFRPDRADFEFRKGPIFTELLLADEINRAPARTQAALLQAMQERMVTADGADYPLGEIFCVVATQNPIESEGTYPLPEAELDRFLFKLLLDYPSEDVEFSVLSRHGAPRGNDEFLGLGVELLFDARRIAQMRGLVYGVEVGADVARYALAVLRATREHPYLRAGASTRAGVMLLRAARALAACYGRSFVIPDDVRELARPTLRHRLFRTVGAELEGTSTDAIIEDILGRVPAPR